MFVKTGDGKITSVIETEELTEEQKKATKNIVVNTKKTAEINDLKAGSN